MISRIPYIRTINDYELGEVTDTTYDSLNDASDHDIMHIVYICLDFFNEYTVDHNY